MFGPNNIGSRSILVSCSFHWINLYKKGQFMPASRKPIIAVVGAGKCSRKLRDRAAEVGRYVAEHGGVVVCGGLGGIMEGAAKGAKEAGGTTIGILPTSERSDANDYIDFAIPTGLGEVRNVLVVRTADVVVAFPGKYGTLTEIAYALHAGKPVISINAWRLGDEMTYVEDPVEAARLAMEMAEKRL
ncbi:MAG: TIGR00725 family protein [candidate division Zixibacteria bacterium]|nr:TIGR00725 family protein [candidate division Zixibacteria bacterium]